MINIDDMVDDDASHHAVISGDAPVRQVDIAICGAGPVGMALAALLVKRGIAPAQIALIDAKTLEQSIADPRSLALSYGSRQLLEQLGAWRNWTKASTASTGKHPLSMT